MRTPLALLLLSCVLPLAAQSASPAPAAMESFQLPSHGSMLNAFAYLAAGPGPHPVVVLLHGFPGNERNLDLAQAIRRAGWDVLYFDYRGSWGTPGTFTFAHVLEDSQAAVDYLRVPANAAHLRADPKTIVLLGHSMGGFAALYTAAHDPNLRATAVLSPADMAGSALLPPNASPDLQKRALAGITAGLASQGMAPLAGCTPASLAAELLAHATEWSFATLGPRIATQPLLVVTSDDGLAPPAIALAAAAKAAGNSNVSTLHLATDHSYSDKRKELEEAVIAGLGELQPK